MTYQLEKDQFFSRSAIWDLQGRYFAEMGFEAWRQGEVPHYITSNPTVANSYAELIFAAYGDLARENPGDLQPVHIVELGAGSGRLAFHLLNKLRQLCGEAGIPFTAFRYVLTDFTQSNVDFWKIHPRFSEFFNSGVLDVALYDVLLTEELQLQISGKTLAMGSLSRPIIVIANYVFDSVPNDLFAVLSGGLQHCLISLHTGQDPENLPAGEILADLISTYSYKNVGAAPFDEPYLCNLLEFYRENLPDDSHVLVPAAGLRCIHRLKRLSHAGLILLSADKGDQQIGSLCGAKPPHLISHGSFSLSVNYHAFQFCCEQTGGKGLFPWKRYNSINISCMFWVADPGCYKLAASAYRKRVFDFGPDDFYTVIRHANKHIPDLSAEEILAFIQLANYDSHQLVRYINRLTELLPEITALEKRDILTAIHITWQNYFPLGERSDLAHDLATFLYAADEYDAALFFYTESTKIYGQDTGTLYNMAACCHLLKRHDQAKKLLELVLENEPGNEQANDLLATCLQYVTGT